MRIGTIVKLAILGAALFCGVQYARVYVYEMQLKKVMGDEALEARRSKYDSAELENNIKHRMDYENVAAPEDIEFVIEGTGDKSKDIVVTARYTNVVNLGVYKHRLSRTLEARADAPKN